MKLEELAEKVGELLLAKQWLLTTAESCTGGWVSQVVTSVSGSSQWFDRGYVTYTNLAKQEMLHVNAHTLSRYGAVSEEVAREMADGALKNSGAQVSLAVTGIAGPEGGTTEKPVGTVWFAWAMNNQETQAQIQHFSGDRTAVRVKSVQFALQRFIEIIQEVS